jgi:hypothetical protein
MPEVRARLPSGALSIVRRRPADRRTENEPKRPRAVAREESGQRRAGAGPAERARELGEREREEEDLEEQRDRTVAHARVSAERGLCAQRRGGGAGRTQTG